MATRSGVLMNVSGVTFTYGTGTPTVVTLDEVIDIQVDDSSDVKEFSADDAPGPTHRKAVNRRRVVKVMVADLAKLRSIPVNTKGTLAWTENDLDNEGGTGSYACTLSNCARNDSKWGGKHNEFKEAEGEFSAVWTKVSNVWTDPLSCVENP